MSKPMALILLMLTLRLTKILPAGVGWSLVLYPCSGRQRSLPQPHTFRPRALGEREGCAGGRSATPPSAGRR